MCRNIKALFNFEPPVTDDEIRAAALQFVRKVSGFNKPSKTNEAAFLKAVDKIAAASRNLLNSLETNAPPRNRAKETAKTRTRAAQRSSTRTTRHPTQHSVGTSNSALLVLLAVCVQCERYASICIRLGQVMVTDETL